MWLNVISLLGLLLLAKSGSESESESGLGSVSRSVTGAWSPPALSAL